VVPWIRRSATSTLPSPPWLGGGNFTRSLTLARQCAGEEVDYPRYLLRLTELEMIERERRTVDFAQSFVRAARSHVVLRSRYVEDELDQAIKRGVSQYVILGAGLDSFAYRKSDLVDVPRVFEVDYPGTQSWKRTRLQQIGVELPPNLTFVPLDFEKQSFIKALRMNGYRPEEPALFSWLGVTPYLSSEAIFNVLRTVASLETETEIIFDYFVPAASLDEENRQLQAALMASTAALGEPILSLFEPASLAAQVRELGFANVWNLGPGG
jgi:methyltransferase (TIGR00027 family)